MKIASVRTALIAAVIVAIGTFLLLHIGGADAQSACIRTITADGSYSGSWASDCLSENTPTESTNPPPGTRYARFYTFTLTAPAEVTIDLTSTTDTYLYLMAGHDVDGAVLRENDDVQSGSTNSRISESLAVGDYTVEATTFDLTTTGDFTLTVSGLPAPVPTLTTQPGVPTPTTEPATPEPTPEPTVLPTPPPAPANVLNRLTALETLTATQQGVISTLESKITALDSRVAALEADATPTPAPSPEPTLTPTPTPEPIESPITWYIGEKVNQDTQDRITGMTELMREYILWLGVPYLNADIAIYVYSDHNALVTIYARNENTALNEAKSIFGDAASARLISRDNGRFYFYVSSDAEEPIVLANLYSLLGQIVNLQINTLRAPSYVCLDQEPEDGPFWLRQATYKSYGVSYFQLRALTSGDYLEYAQERRVLAGRASRENITLEDVTTGPAYWRHRISPAQEVLALELLAARAGERSLIHFYSLLGPETTWRQAFQTAFGMSIDEFYQLLDEHRAAGYPELDIPNWWEDETVQRFQPVALGIVDEQYIEMSLEASGLSILGSPHTKKHAETYLRLNAQWTSFPTCSAAIRLNRLSLNCSLMMWGLRERYLGQLTQSHSNSTPTSYRCMSSGMRSHTI